jgi:hypothetical protein
MLLGFTTVGLVADRRRNQTLLSEPEP